MSCNGNCSECATKNECPNNKQCNGDCKNCDSNKECPNREKCGCSEDKCANCPSKGRCGAPDRSEENMQLAATLQRFGHILLVLSGKGGVGKSTIATQLSFFLAERCNKHVALLDLDVCGPSVPTMTSSVGAEIEQNEAGYLIPVRVSGQLQSMSVGYLLGSADQAVIFRGPKKHGLIQQLLTQVGWDLAENQQENWLIIDTPPGTGDEHLSITSLIKGARILMEGQQPIFEGVVVATPQEVALSDVRKELDFCKKLMVPVKGVVENMSGFVCPSCGNKSEIFFPTKGGCAKMCEEYGVKLLGKLPLDPVLVKAGEEGQPWAGLIEEESLGLEAFEEIVGEILKD